ncbi:hypothetical protein ACRCPS_17935 [Pseudomonas aeruginosa]
MLHHQNACSKGQPAKAYQATRSESMDGPEVGSFLTYFVYSAGVGEYHAEVCNAYDAPVFEITGKDIFEDGLMQDERDRDGLKSYLVKLGIMTPTQRLIMG